MLDTSKTKGKAKPDIPAWEIEGELILNCNCTVFCPCVVSLGEHPPTEGSCRAWLGVRIDKGKSGRVKLDGRRVAMILDIPGKMSEGNWKGATYVDDDATDAQFDALAAIFSGQARGTTGLFRLLMSEHLGTFREEIRFETEGKTRHLTVGRKIQGAVEPVPGGNADEDIVIRNSQYWIAPDVTVGRALKGKVRDLGRVWNFDGRSAEICDIAWSGP